MVVSMAPTAVYADSHDEEAMVRVGNAIDNLWSFVDTTGSLPDSQFYAQFADRALSARDEANSAYQELGKTTERGDTRQAVFKIRQDVGQMSTQLLQWRGTALNGDSDGFSTVNNELGDTVTTFNADVNTYNGDKDGNRSAYEVGAYASAPAAAFLLSCLLFAWAVYRNDKQDDVVRELHRRLRWRAAYSSLAVLVGSAAPTIAFFLNAVVSPWLWLFVVPGASALLFTLVRYLKVWLLTRRQAAAD
jgi:hypothetical protein